MSTTPVVDPGGPMILVINPGGPNIPAPISLDKGVTVHAEATDAFTKTIAILPGLTASHLSQLSGVINWGDKTTSGATFVRAADGTIHVHGTHTYAKPGEYKVSLRITERPYSVPGQPTPDYILLLPAITTDAVVRDNKPAGVSLARRRRIRVPPPVSGHLISPTSIWFLSARRSPGATARPSTDQIKLESGDKYEVLGTHTYAHSGSYKVQVKVGSHKSGKSASTGTVADIFSTVKVKS